MNVHCASCQTQYEINTAKVPPGGGFIRCKNCGERIRIPAPEPAAPSEAIPLAGSPAPSVHAAVTIPLPVVDLRPAATATEVPQEEQPAAMAHAPSAEPTPKPPDFLNDLPAAAGAKKMRKEEPRDLPGPVTAAARAPVEEKFSPPTTAVAPPLGSDDSLDIDTGDFPAAPALPEVKKSPAVEVLEESPSDLPAPEVEAPSLMDELLAPAPSVAAVPAATAAASLAAAPAPAAAPSRRRLALIAGVLGGSVALLAAVALLTPWFGLQITGGAQKTAAPDTRPREGAPSKSKAKEAIPEPAKPPALEQAKEVALTASNVDSFSYAELKTAVVGLAGSAPEDDSEKQALLSWALFRLAARFGDAEATELLADRVVAPPAIAALDSLGAAAALGGMVVMGKAPAARKLGERLQKSKLKDSGRAAYVMALTYTRKPELPKAVRQLERALRLAPEIGDAKLRLLELQLAGAQADEAVAGLVQLATTTQDPAAAVRVAGLLEAAGKLAALELAAAAIDDPAQTARVPAPEQAAYLRLVIAKKLRAGNVAGATAAAERWAAHEPTSARAAITLARLKAASGGDAAATLAAALTQVEDETSKAELVAAQARLAVERNDLSAARSVLAAAPPGGRDALGWRKLAEGWVAQAAGERVEARAAFAAAGRGRPKFFEARLAAALMESDKPAALMKKLTDLDHKGLPEATYHLGKLMLTRGNHAGASELFNRVLWQDPTVVDPVQLLSEWIEVLGRAGEATRADALAAALDQARPADLRPVRALIATAMRHGQHEVALKWLRALAERQPDNPKLKVELAGALVDAKQDREAEVLLEEMFKATPASRDAEALVQLARAWRERDAFRAKDLLNEAVAIKPTAATYLLLGDVENARGRADDAKTAYTKAVELDPSLVAAQLRLARLQFDAGAYDVAVRLLERVLAKRPDAAEAAEMLGDALVEQGKVREGLRQYEAVLETDGERGPLLMKVARLQLEQLGQLGPSIQTLRRVIKADPELAEAHYFLGVALKDLGKVAEARQELQAYVRMAPNGEFAAEARRTVSDMENL